LQNLKAPPQSTEAPIPKEGLDLAFLKGIKADLEKVGRMIVEKNGEKFLQRAQVLASINYLAANVPSCVIQHLGQEINEKVQKKNPKSPRNKSTFSVLSMPKGSTSDSGDCGLPYVSVFECALLFGTSISSQFQCKLKKYASYLTIYFLLVVDISGFTKLSTMMNPESLSKVISKSTHFLCYARYLVMYSLTNLTSLHETRQILSAHRRQSV
jgi:hypothetical protein